MELHPGEVGARHEGRELAPVAAGGQRVGAGIDRVAVHEIRLLPGRDALQQRMRPLRLQRVPAHVRQAQAGARGQPAHAPR